MVMSDKPNISKIRIPQTCHSCTPPKVFSGYSPFITHLKKVHHIHFVSVTSPCIERHPTSQSVLFGDQFINLSLLAKESKLSVSMISKVFACKITPSLPSAIRIAAALHMDVGRFIEALQLMRQFHTVYSPRALRTTKSVEIPVETVEIVVSQ